MKRFAVIGNPISHSKSPDLFNSVFSDFNFDAHYTRIASDKITEVYELIAKLKIDGINITSPYKSSFYEFVDYKSTDLDLINTVIKTADKWIGYNTDIIAIKRLIIECKLSNFKVLIIGAGDTAKTVLQALKDFNCELSLSNRTFERTKSLLEINLFNFINFNELKSTIKAYDLIINTIPKIDIELEIEDFSLNQIIIDAIYHRPFLHKFADKVNYISGLKWLEYQAIPFMELILDIKSNNKQILSSYENYELCHSERSEEFSKRVASTPCFSSTPCLSMGLTDITKGRILLSGYFSTFRMTNPNDSVASNDISKRKILFYLIGFSGSGKSIIAKELALRLSYKCFDTDEMIEKKENQPISSIFNNFGEEYFRNIEIIILKQVSKESNAIIACGGGITGNPENIEIMKQSGYIIWIYSDFNDCFTRIDLNNKPMFKSNESFQNLYCKREDSYFKSSDLIIYNNKDLSNIVNKIYAEINNII